MTDFSNCYIKTLVNTCDNMHSFQPFISNNWKLLSSIFRIIPYFIIFFLSFSEMGFCQDFTPFFED